MRITDFDFETENHVEALKRGLRNAKHLNAMHTPRIKEAFDIAAVLDDLDNGRDPETGEMVLPRMLRAYNNILDSLGLRYDKPIGRPTEERREQEKQADVRPRPPSELDKYRMRIVNNGSGA